MYTYIYIYIYVYTYVHIISGTRKWWFMKWGSTNGSKMHTSKYVRKEPIY